MDEFQKKMKEAKESIEVAGLPKEFQKIAFSKFMDKLLDDKNSKKMRKSDKARVYARDGEKKRKGKNEANVKLQEETQKMINTLSRSKNSVIYKLETALEQSLFILKIAEDEHSIRGLTPGQISSVLKSVFKIATTQAAVSMALMKAAEYTDRKKINLGGTFAFKYEIMQKGEDYLEKRLKEVNNQESKMPENEEDENETKEY